MRLLSYNILDGGLGRADPIAEVIQANNPDVVVLIEADDPWVRDRIARRLRMEQSFAAGKKHGIAFLSRYPIRWSINYAPLLDGISNCFAAIAIGCERGTGINGVPALRVLGTNDPCPSDHLVIAATHLHPRAAIADEQRRLAEVGILLNTLAPLRTSLQPHLLVGDFNANSPVQNISRDQCKPSTRKQIDENGGVIPRSAIAEILAAGYLDSLHTIHPAKAANAGTFTTQHPGQRVDYAFTFGLPRERLTDAWIETDRLATYASDHYPIGLALSDGSRNTDPAVNSPA